MKGISKVKRVKGWNITQEVKDAIELVRKSNKWLPFKSLTQWSISGKEKCY